MSPLLPVVFACAVAASAAPPAAGAPGAARSVAVLPVAGGARDADELRGALEAGVDTSGAYLHEPRAVADAVVGKAKAAGLRCQPADAECWRKVAVVSGIDSVLVSTVTKSSDGKRVLHAMLVDAGSEAPRLDSIELVKAGDARVLVERMIAPAATSTPPPTPTEGVPTAETPVTSSQTTSAIPAATAARAAAASAAATPSAQPVTSAAPRARPRLLVLELRTDGIDASAARLLRDELTTALARDAKSVDVMSIEDLRRQMAHESEKLAAGNCVNESCAAEIADALGAELVVYGDVGRIGELVIAHVTMHDARANSTLARETIEVARVEDLVGGARTVARTLAARLDASFRGPSTAAPSLSPWIVAGGVAAGAGALALAGGGVAAVVCASIVTDVRLVADGGPDGAARSAAQQTGQLGVVVAAAGAVVAAGGAAALAVGVLE